MACCTETIRCQEARYLAEQYYDVKESRMKDDATRERVRERAAAYTQHLIDAGVFRYGTTAVPTPPSTWA